jgi:hypothetical protein
VITRCVRTLFVIAALTWSTASCSASSGETPEVTPTSSAITALPRLFTICTASIPSDWATALSRSSVAVPFTFSPAALDPVGDIAYGYFQSGAEQGVVAVNLANGQYNLLYRMPANASGVGWMTFSDPWLAWEQGDAQDNLGNWSIQIYNTATKQYKQLATSQLSDGHYLTGQLAFPVAGHGYVAWSQPTSETSADLRVYRFASGQSLTIDSGRLSSPIFVANNLVWGKFAAGESQPSFQMVDADTLRSAAVPAALRQPRSIGYLAGSADYILWTDSTSALTTDQLASGRISKYTFVSDAGKHPFQFPTLVGHFVVWFTGSVNTVLDLETGKAFDIGLPSAITGADDTIVIGKIGATKTIVSAVHLTKTMGIQSCS